MDFSRLHLVDNYSTSAALLVSRANAYKIYFTQEGDIVYRGIKYTKSPSEIKFEDLSEDFLKKLAKYTKEQWDNL